MTTNESKPPRGRHFSMLRGFHLADWFTLANALCGTWAVFAAMRYLQHGNPVDLMLGMSLIPLAFVFDALDGRVARWRKVASTLGRELDSLADVISFGVAPAAIGYAQAADLPFELGIIRNHYVGRTFIEPTDQIRNMGVRVKLNVNRALIAGKRVILVDDSVVRGTPSRKIKQMYVSAAVQEQLARGQLAICADDESFVLVPRVVADKIAERDASVIIFLADPQKQALAEDDPYKDFPIPDDLMW